MQKHAEKNFIRKFHHKKLIAVPLIAVSRSISPLKYQMI